jgi:uncharacterized membrane protein YgcG
VAGALVALAFILLFWAVYSFNRRSTERTAVRREQQKLERERQYREWQKKQHQTAKVTYPRKRSQLVSVATPRTPTKAHTPTRTGVIRAEIPEPSYVAQATSQDNTSFADGVITGLLISSVLDDDRPSTVAQTTSNDPTPSFDSGGGGDFGGGGASGSWSDDSSSSSSFDSSFNEQI